MDAKNFKDLKSDYMKLYAELGIPYRGESKDEMKFAIMKFADTVRDEDVQHIKTIAAPKAPTQRKVAVVTEIPEGSPDSSAFKAKVTYVDPGDQDESEPAEETKVRKGNKKAKAATKQSTAPEPNTKLTWNQFISQKAKEHPDLSRKDLMVRYSGEEWNKYKAQWA